jgi:hypothetical protein
VTIAEDSDGTKVWLGEPSGRNTLYSERESLLGAPNGISNDKRAFALRLRGAIAILALCCLMTPIKSLEVRDRVLAFIWTDLLGELSAMRLMDVLPTGFRLTL